MTTLNDIHPSPASRIYDRLAELLPNQDEQILAIDVHGVLSKAYCEQLKAMTGLIVDGQRATRICHAALATCLKTADEARLLAEDGPNFNVGS